MCSELIGPSTLGRCHVCGWYPPECGHDSSWTKEGVFKVTECWYPYTHQGGEVRTCDFCQTWHSGSCCPPGRATVTELTNATHDLSARVAELEAQLATARSEERERCAKAAEAVTLPDRWIDGSGLSHSERCAANDAAGLIVDAIRALTPTPEANHE